ncbi:endolysin glycosyl hydrolase [Serratia phage SMP]|uniref:Endolysin glycosyl hydrolase n=1 Tax=Serratia phage SMP TaxID=2982904 RepID=A0A9E8JWM6_9CAUD|nr:endolysin glycosyl hydrolase [Serratia phage SMP]
MKLTIGIIMASTGASKDVANKWIDALQVACDKYEINNRRRVAMFLANLGVESEGFTALAENMNYSAKRMAAVWPGRYAIDPKANTKQPNALALSLANNPQKLANNVYANRLGNGDEASGDGWNFRGQGPIQQTGRDNITRAGKAIGVDLANNPALLQTPEVGALAAAYFWYSNDLNRAADLDLFSQSVKKINGQLPCDANKGEVRRSYYRAGLAAIDAGA